MNRAERRRKLEKARFFGARTPPSAVSAVDVEMLKEGDEFRSRVVSMWFEDDDLHTVTIQPLRIAWKYSVDKIKNDFWKWLGENQPELPPGAERTGKNSAVALRVALKALGARRLLRGMTIKAVTEYTRRILGRNVGGLYHDAANWSNAKNWRKASSTRVQLSRSNR